MTVFLLIVIAVLLLILFSRSADRPESPEPPSAPAAPHIYPHQTWEKNHFINKHQHRNDEAHARHKRNQTPW